MKTGKASESVLKRSVFKQLHTKRDEVISAAGTGLDAAVLKLDADEMTVLSTNPVMGTLEELGEYGVLSVVSNLAAAGATPVGILLTILLPEKEDERTLKKIVAQAQEVCGRYQIQILGGHTEVTKAVNQPVLSLVAVGKAKKES
ncbi:MAG: AIR synthase related protein, partial [Roseburia sp.]|nr:AIR synthase related protein [Roseburia sp.]